MSDKNAYWLLIAIVTLSIASALIGIMFGFHHDEPRIMNSARESFNTGNPLPGWYVYPSLPHDLATLVQFTKYFSFIYPGFEEPWKQHLMVRGVFILYSCSGIIFTFFLTKSLSQNNLISLISAALLAFSWEFGYHSRWIAPDTIMMANGIACVLFCLRYYQTSKPLFFILAGIFGGLATASKYPAGLVILPLLFSTYFKTKVITPQNRFLDTLWKRWIQIGGLASLTFILTTPGFIFDFSELFQDLNQHINIYKTGYTSHNVDNPPFDHFLRLSEYFSLAVFCHQPILSLIGSFFIIPGIYSLKQFSIKVNMIVFTLPLVYFIFFCFQSVMIVRNYQLLLPFLFILSALGFQKVMTSLNPPIFKKLLLLVPSLVITFNIYFSFKTAFSIFYYDKDDLCSNFEKYLENNPRKEFYLSKELKRDCFQSIKKLPNNVLTQKSPPHNEYKVATYNPGNPEKYFWPDLRHNSINKVIGQQEVNFNYYPTWASYPKIIIIAGDKYEKIQKAIKQKSQ